MRYCLLVFILFTSVISCRPDDDTKSAALGEPVDVVDLAKEILEVVDQRPISGIKQGEQAFYISNLRVENSPEVLAIGETWHTATHVIDHEDIGVREIVIEDRIVAYEKDGNDMVVRENVYKIPIPQNPEQKTDPRSILNPQTIHPLALVNQTLTAIESLGELLLSTAKEPTYHNMEVVHRIMDAPAAVRQDPTCKGLTNCVINVKEIQYDLAQWKLDGSYDKYHFVLRLSADLPSLAVYFSECASYLADITDDEGLTRNYHISTCRVLKDFSWKAPTDPV